MRRRHIWIVALLAVVALGTGLFLFRFAREPTPSVRVGSVLPLTGPAASLGEWIRNGYELALESISQSSESDGLKIALFIEDGKGDPATSLSAFNKLSAVDDVEIVTTTLSPVALALIPAVERKGLILFAAAAHPAITGSYKRAFRHNLTTQSESQLMVSHLQSHVQPPDVRLVRFNDDYGAAFQQAWQSLLADTTINQLPSMTFSRESTDLRSIAVKAAADSPSCIAVVGYGAPMGTLIRRLRESGFTGTLIANSAVGFPDVKSAAGEALSGVIYVDYLIDHEDADYQSLNQRYRERFGTDIPPIALFEHNTILLIYQTLEAVDGDVSRFPDHLRTMASTSLPGEIVTITEAGDIVPALRINTAK